MNLVFKQGSTVEIYLQRQNPDKTGASLDGYDLLFQIVNREGAVVATATVGNGITIRERAKGKYSVKIKLPDSLPIGKYKADCIYKKGDDCFPSDTLYIEIVNRIARCPL